MHAAVLILILASTSCVVAADELLMGSFVLSGSTTTVTTAIDSTQFNTNLESELTTWLEQPVIAATTFLDSTQKSLSVSFSVACASEMVAQTRTLISTGDAAGNTAVLRAHAAAAGTTTFSTGSLTVVWEQCSSSLAARAGGIPEVQTLGPGTVSTTCPTSVMFRLSATSSLAGLSQTLCEGIITDTAFSTATKVTALAACVAETSMVAMRSSNVYIATQVTFTSATTSYYTALLMNALRTGGLSSMAVVEVAGLYTTTANGGENTVDAVVYSTITTTQYTETIITCADKMKWLAFLILGFPLFVVISRAVFRKGKESGIVHHYKQEELNHQRMQKLAEMQREAAGGAYIMTTAPQAGGFQQQPQFQQQQPQFQQQDVNQHTYQYNQQQGYGDGSSSVVASSVAR